MRLETLSITAGGRALTEWQSIEIEAGVDQAVRTAVLQMHPSATPPWPDEKALISANGSVILTGYVRDVSPSWEEEGYSVRVTFVSRTVDAVEASIVHATGFVKDKTLAAIADAFDSCGVGVDAEGAFEVQDRHQIVPGESLYSTLEPLARAEGAMIYDTPGGRLRITNKAGSAHAGGLAVGVNIISGSALFSGREKFDPVLTRGQQSRGDGPQALRPEGKAADASVGRYRPKIMVLDVEATAARVQKATEWQIRRAAGESTTADIVASGWRDQDGALWTPNRQVYVHHPKLFLDQMMAIKGVRFAQDTTGDGRTVATLSLVDPRALGGKASPGGKSGRAWQGSEPQASYQAQ